MAAAVEQVLRHQAESMEMQVERHLAVRRLPLAFSPELEQRFEAETSRDRSRMLFRQSVIGLAIYLGFGLSDFLLVPDVAGLASLLRFGLVGPLSVIAITLLWFNPSGALRESLVAGTSVLAGLLTLLIMLMSGSPTRDLLADSTLLIMLFIAVVQRARYFYAIAACVLLFVGNLAAVYLLGDYGNERVLSSALVLSGATLLIGMASYALECEFRRAYLLRLRERLLNSALDDMSRHDPMTGLENRRSLDLAFTAIARDANPGEDIAVVLLDIDHFKAYNDSLGHMAGDEALRRVAQELRAGLRAGTDRAFRFGGEEFLLLLRRTTLGEAVQLAERLRRRVETAALPHPLGGGAVVTASFGAAAARAGGEIGSDELVAGADAALYAAKASGRNQVWPPLRITRQELPASVSASAPQALDAS